ncbi:MAG: hypothetical protein ACOYLI_03645 [Synechococcus lacustris]
MTLAPQSEELKAFSARFRAETLEGFKAICKSQNKQYTKVLETLAESYVRVQGNLRQAVVECLREGTTESEVTALLGGMGSDLAEKIHEIESTTQASLNEVKGSSESLDLRLASLEEMLAEMSQGSERTRVEIVGGTVGPRSEVNNEEALVLAPKDWRELVGRFMELEVAVRSEDSGLEMRVEILEGIAEEQGFSVRWEGDSDSQSSSLTMGMGQEIDMHELI